MTVRTFYKDCTFQQTLQQNPSRKIQVNRTLYG